MMRWKGCERNLSCPNLSYYADIGLDGLRKTMKLSQDSLRQILAKLFIL
jgi:hypothetical protein